MQIKLILRGITWPLQLSSQRVLRSESQLGEIRSFGSTDRAARLIEQTMKGLGRSSEM